MYVFKFGMAGVNGDSAKESRFQAMKSLFGSREILSEFNKEYFCIFVNADYDNLEDYDSHYDTFNPRLNKDLIPKGTQYNESELTGFRKSTSDFEFKGAWGHGVELLRPIFVFHRDMKQDTPYDGAIVRDIGNDLVHVTILPSRSDERTPIQALASKFMFPNLQGPELDLDDIDNSDSNYVRKNFTFSNHCTVMVHNEVIRDWDLIKNNYR